MERGGERRKSCHPRMRDQRRTGATATPQSVRLKSDDSVPTPPAPTDIMFLRRLRTSAALRRAVTDGGVLAALRAELAHELSSAAASAPPTFPSQDALGFDTVSDDPRAQDVLLRRRTGSEEVLVSAVLAPLLFVGQAPERSALMKVFVTKPGATPVLRFDCRTSAYREDGGGSAAYCIEAVRYQSSPDDAGEGKYEGPSNSDLNPELLLALEEYLKVRAVNSKLTAALLHHLVEKERAQYVNWLKTMEETFARNR